MEEAFFGEDEERNLIFNRDKLGNLVARFLRARREINYIRDWETVEILIWLLILLLV